MNAQNIPEKLHVVRRAFVPKHDGWVLSDFDLSKIEPRLLAYFASKKGDDTLAGYLRQGRDPYKAVVSQMFGKPEHELTDAEYKRGKILFLSLMYGGGVKTIQAQFGIGREEARALIKQFHDAWPIVRVLQDDVLRVVNKRGYIKTPWGRRLHLEEFGEHKLLNKLIQGSAAGIMKKAVIEVDRYLRADPDMKSHAVSVIHDELILDGPVDELEWLHEDIPRIMAEAAGERVTQVVPVLVDHEVSLTNWAEKRKYEEVIAELHTTAAAA